MDGHFVPTISFGSAACSSIRRHISGVMDVHLMISPVEGKLEWFAEAGADIITVHTEAGPHLHRYLQEIRELGCKAGVAINPGTPATSVYPVLDLVELICVMTVNPGAGGQQFLHSQLAKVSQIKEIVGERQIDIQVDGGIAPTTATLAVKAGANVFVAGSAIFNGTVDAMEDRIRALQHAISLPAQRVTT